jgi:hypothetical protein
MAAEDEKQALLNRTEVRPIPWEDGWYRVPCDVQDD